MDLSDLQARDLARLDAVCLEFESKLRERLSSLPPESADEAAAECLSQIEALVSRHGGEHADVLRSELAGISKELCEQQRASQNPASSESINNADTEFLSERPGEGVPLPVQSSTDGLASIGDQIGPYQITGVLGQGGMGIVYKANDSRLDRSVAIKMLCVEGKHATTLAERFQREAKAVAGLTHPHIVELFDIGAHNGMPYAVMEHLKGETLSRRLDARRLRVEPASPALVRRWGQQLAEALAMAHSAGVIHRDLKPDNVMLMASSKPEQGDALAASTLKLFDFGLSRSESIVAGTAPGTHAAVRGGTVNPSATSASTPNQNNTPTQAGMILGTPGYMAPEQARGEVATTAADVFALGSLLFEAFYAEPAFPGDTPTRRFAAVLEHRPSGAPERRQTDTQLADLIDRMLAKDPAERPSAAAVATALTNPSRIGTGSTNRASKSRTGGSAATLSPEGDFSTSGPSGRSVAMSPTGDVIVSRRRVFELIGGGIVGGVLGQTLLPPGNAEDLSSIRSIGVLSFRPADSDDNGVQRRSPGDVLLKGDLLAGLLNNELARLEGITVPKFVPIQASTPDDVRRIAEELEVDALISGSFSQTAVGGPMTVNLQILSGKTGRLIDGFVVPTVAGDNLIEQSALAQEVARMIGKQLSEGDEKSGLVGDKQEAFTCLIKGRVRSTPDTDSGLEMALKCFEHALTVDETYAEAHAGIALTSITLASRVEDSQAQQLIADSQAALREALRLSPRNTDAKLAEAMIDYQVLADFDRARQALEEISESVSNHWQVQHQLSWIRLLQLEEASAMQSMRRAAGLHPASGWLKTDLARAEWFRGYPERALSQAKALARQDNPFAKGLLIDIYEQLGQLEEAAKLDPGLSLTANSGRNAYFDARKSRLREMPYGPFGPTINASILQLRNREGLDREPADQILARLIAAGLPMLPLVLCKHPAFSTLTLLEQAVETFSVLKIG